jgi:WD40 repeat protein
VALGSVLAVAFSPDGHTLASADLDGTVWLTDAADPAPLPARAAPDRRHWRCRIGRVQPVGHTLASGIIDGRSGYGT